MPLVLSSEGEKQTKLHPPPAGFTGCQSHPALMTRWPHELPLCSRSCPQHTCLSYSPLTTRLDICGLLVLPSSLCQKNLKGKVWQTILLLLLPCCLEFPVLFFWSQNSFLNAFKSGLITHYILQNQECNHALSLSLSSSMHLGHFCHGLACLLNLCILCGRLSVCFKSTGGKLGKFTGYKL